MSSDSNIKKINSEQPPCLDYTIRLATPSEKNIIVSHLKDNNRQTMNFRTMKDAQALVLFEKNNPEKMIGWQGFTVKGFKGIPEKFSLHLDTHYRSFLLGLALETVLYKYLQSNGLKYTVLRMDKKSTESLLNYRMATGIVKPISSEDMPEDWLAMCGECELYKKSCVEQVFFRVDVLKGIEFGEKRLGPLGAMNFPVHVKLIENRIRKDERKKFSATWAA